jgi:hypothetical protein
MLVDLVWEAWVLRYTLPFLSDLTQEGLETHNLYSFS